MAKFSHDPASKIKAGAEMMGGKDGSPGGGTFTWLRCALALGSTATFSGIFLGWSAYFDRTWLALLGFPLACLMFGLIVVIGGLMIDKADASKIKGPPR